MMIIVSACLVGIQCRYSGGCNFHSGVLSHLEGKQWIPVCPEQLGGLPTPRTPAEIKGGSGEDVLSGNAEIFTKDGVKVTDEYIKGAQETLKIAQLTGATEAILKAKSPSCGNCQIYDGTFQRQIIQGQGVTAALLSEHGFRIRSEEDF